MKLGMGNQPKRDNRSDLEEKTSIQSVEERKGDFFRYLKGMGSKKKSVSRKKGWDDICSVLNSKYKSYILITVDPTDIVYHVRVTCTWFLGSRHVVYYCFHRRPRFILIDIFFIFFNYNVIWLKGIIAFRQNELLDYNGSIIKLMWTSFEIQHMYIIFFINYIYKYIFYSCLII